MTKEDTIKINNEMKLSIQSGNNLELLKGYPDNYFDSVVTDCPYGLGKEPDALKLMQDWIDHGYHEIEGKGFMGKTWDAFVPQPIFWKEVFRVLKPGGYVLAFFGTRTYDWGTLSIRVAGFEIRDCISWMYGSGFPKSLDISKAIDKKLGKNRILTKPGMVKRNGYGDDWDTGSSKDRPKYDLPVSNEARQFEGYGTALKPAHELITVARKPIEGTVAENVLKYGTGGINLDGCRIDLTKNDDNRLGGNGSWTTTKKQTGNTVTLPRGEVSSSELGRFPANVIFDPFMANELDKQTGVLTSGKPTGTRKANNNIYGHYERGQDITGFGDSGGASRFFYCAKASQFERNAGCEHLEPIKTNDGREIDADNAYQREKNERNNFHPTVKPLALMSYLQRLVTPKGGKTLDPFAGSGTSGCSAYF